MATPHTHTDPAGLFNVYICSICSKELCTLNRHSGITPFMISCFMTEGCEGPMLSTLYEVTQSPPPPHQYEFVRATVEQLRKLGNLLGEGETKQGRLDIDVALLTHHERGGLFLSRDGKLVE